MALRQLQSVTKPRSSRDPRALVLSELRDELDRASMRCAHDPNDDNVHDLRVATRRLRALVRAFRAEIRPRDYESLRFDLKQIGRLLEPARSASVRLTQAAELFDHYHGGDRRDGAQLNTLFLKTIELRRRELAALLQSDLWQQRHSRIAAVLADENFFLSPGVPAQFFFRQTLHRTLDKVQRTAGKQHDDMRSLHRQRIKIKRARYVITALAPLLSLDAERALDSMSSAQDALGGAHDWNSLADWLQAVAAASPLYNTMINDIDKRQRKFTKRFHKLQPSLQRRLKKFAVAVNS
jgi:CHAD domain-containing protein